MPGREVAEDRTLRCRTMPEKEPRRRGALREASAGGFGFFE
ncbi:hypothetical protein ALIPUT_02117 [Alistipes putredinis DSM 17216]|uniref:Uncharacterized protein n=1 Tax=Alistipes putredinis DSM 17216 TaxID=445970 RepID=B0MXZ8_9BACT|nr:hypothetical protein ALIPUT_02117 [Alistipes putredinis DSM 17216]